MTILSATHCAPPDFARTRRPRGAKSKGLAYERALAKALGPSWKHGLWFQYQTENGTFYCQPDFFGIYRGATYIIECKYTWVAGAFDKLRALYIPVLEKALAQQAFGIVVCKTLTPEALLVVETVQEAVAHADRHCVPTWHWLGKTALGPQKRPARKAGLDTAHATS